MTRALIFDTELTGLGGEIIEAAWIELQNAPSLFDGGDEIKLPLLTASWFCQRYKPSAPMSFGAMAVHHILPGDLDSCPESSQFRLPADTNYIIGHSIDNDWVAAGSPQGVRRIDTHAIARWLWPDATGYSQVALIYMLNGATCETREFVRERAHNAFGDARMCKDLLEHILVRVPDIKTWSQLWEYSEECRIPRTCPLKRWDGVLLRDMDFDAILWCLRQHWIDPYFRKGLNRVLESRRGVVVSGADEECEPEGEWW